MDLKITLDDHLLKPLIDAHLMTGVSVKKQIADADLGVILEDLDQIIGKYDCSQIHERRMSAPMNSRLTNGFYYSNNPHCGTL